jgi:hypothetical protein
LYEVTPERIYKNIMRVYGIALLMAVTAALIVTPRPLTANTISDTGLAPGETTSDAIQWSPSDIVTDSASPFFGTSDGATDAETTEADFLLPEFLSLEQGSFPPHLYRTQEILKAVPEPDSMQWITCSFFTVAWIGRRKRP